MAAAAPSNKRPLPCPLNAPHYNWAKYLYDGPWAALFEPPQQGRNSMQLANSGWLRTERELEAAVGSPTKLDVKVVDSQGQPWGPDKMYATPTLIVSDKPGKSEKDRTLRRILINTNGGPIPYALAMYTHRVMDKFTCIPQFAYGHCAHRLYGGSLPHVLHPIGMTDEPIDGARSYMSTVHEHLTGNLIEHQAYIRGFMKTNGRLNCLVDIFIQMVRGVMELYSVGLVHTNPDPVNFVFQWTEQKHVRIKLSEFDWVHVHPRACDNPKYKQVIDALVLEAPRKFPPKLEKFKLSENDFGDNPDTIERVLCDRLLLSFSILCITYGGLGLFDSVKTKEAEGSPAIIELHDKLFRMTPSRPGDDVTGTHAFNIFHKGNFDIARNTLASSFRSQNRPATVPKLWRNVIGGSHKSLADLFLALQDLYAALGDNTPGCKRAQNVKEVVALSNQTAPSFFSFHIQQEAGIA